MIVVAGALCNEKPDGADASKALGGRRAEKIAVDSNVTTVSTFPPEGTFAQDAETVARIMASKRVSPKGIGSGIRMIQYFINRAGKGLSKGRRKELEKAKRILQKQLRGEKRAQARPKGRKKAGATRRL